MRDKGFSLLIRYFNWHIFVPIFLLFFSYVFGVAVELLGEVQLFIRAFVIVFCFVSSLFFAPSFSVQSLVFFVFFTIYVLVLYLVNGGVLALNFLYIAVVLFYFYGLRVERTELLYCSLVSGFLVIFLYVIYFYYAGLSFEPVTLGGRTRYYFGFTNPNKVGIVAYSFVVLSTLYFFGRNSFLLMLICIPFVVATVYSDSRTALYAIVIFFSLIFFPAFARFRRLIVLFPIIFFIGSFFISGYSENDFLNAVLSNRPIDFNDFISGLEGYSFIFGASSEGYRIDNSYILFYFAVGPLGVVLFLYFLFKASSGRISGAEFSFMVSVMAYGVMEGVLVRVEFPVVIYFYCLVFGRNSVLK